MLAAFAISTPAQAADAGKDYVPGELLVSFEGERDSASTPEGVGVAECVVICGQPGRLLRASQLPRQGRRGAQRSRPQRPTPRVAKPAVELRSVRIELWAVARPLSFEAPGGINALDAWTTIARAVRKAGGAQGRGARHGDRVQDQEPNFRKSPDFSAKQFIGGYDFVKGKSLLRPRRPRDTCDRHDRRAHQQRGRGHRPGARGEDHPRPGAGFAGCGQRPRHHQGIRYAAKREADVINMSFEFSRRVTSCKQIRSVCKALRFATKQHNALVVAASGNGGVAGGLSGGELPGAGATGAGSRRDHTGRLHRRLLELRPRRRPGRARDAGRDRLPATTRATRASRSSSSPSTDRGSSSSDSRTSTRAPRWPPPMPAAASRRW